MAGGSLLHRIETSTLAEKGPSPVSSQRERKATASHVTPNNSRLFGELRLAAVVGKQSIYDGRSVTLVKNCPCMAQARDGRIFARLPVVAQRVESGQGMVLDGNCNEQSIQNEVAMGSCPASANKPK